MKNKLIFLFSVLFFSCSSGDDNPNKPIVEEPYVPLINKIKREFYKYRFENAILDEYEELYEYGSNGYVSKHTRNFWYSDGSIFNRISTFNYSKNNTLDSINILSKSGDNPSASKIVFEHNVNNQIVKEIFLNSDNKVINSTVYDYNGDQLKTVKITQNSNTTTIILKYENGVYVNYDDNERKFDNKNTPQANLYSPDYQKVKYEIFPHNMIYNSNGKYRDEYFYEYNQEDYPLNCKVKSTGGNPRFDITFTYY